MANTEININVVINAQHHHILQLYQMALYNSSTTNPENSFLYNGVF